MKTLVRYLGGSHLYGLNTEKSDLDYRTVFAHTDPIKIFRFRKNDAISNQTEEIDSLDTEIVHFFRQIEKCGTSALEGLFSPNYIYVSPFFKNQIVQERNRLLDSEKIYSSLCGYIKGEYRLATGERTGRLGGKRKDSLDLYGFSPKNFSHLFRLMGTGTLYFQTGEYMPCLKNECKEIHDLCYAVKTEPGIFTKKQLCDIFDDTFLKLEKAKENCSKEILERKFDLEYVGKVLFTLYCVL